MNLLIIDGQGGQLGVQLIKEILARAKSSKITELEKMLSNDQELH